MPGRKFARRRTPNLRRLRSVVEKMEGRLLLAGTPDLSQLKSNLDSTFTDVNGVIQSTISMTPIPFVGSKIGSAINTLTNLQTEFDSALTSITSSSTAQQVQSALQSALPGATVTIVQNTSSTDEFSITQTVASAPETNGPTLKFNLGLPALKMSGNIGLNVSLGYNYALDFGINTTGGFFISTDPTKTNFTFAPTITIAAGSQLTGAFGPLALTATDYTGDPQNLSIGPTLLTATFTAGLTAPNNATTLSTTTLSQVGVNMTLAGNAHLALLADLGAAGSGGEDTFSTEFPSISTVLTIDWAFPQFTLNSTSGLSIADFGSEPTVGFNNISLDLGSALQGMIGPVVDELYKVLSPIKPIVDFINGPMPLFNDIGVLKDLLNTSSTNGVATVGDFFTFLAGLLGEGSEAQSVVDFASYVGDIYNLYDAVNAMSGTGGISLGSYTIGGGNSGDVSPADDSGSNVIGDVRDPSQVSSLDFSNLISSTNVEGQLQNLLGSGGTDFINDVFGGAPDSVSPPTGSFGSNGQYQFDTNSADYGLHFPILSNPGSILGMLFGQDVNLFTFTTPPLYLGVPFEVNIPIFGPLVVALIGNLGDGDAVLFGGQFSCGYDTYGLTDGNPMDGFYVNDSDSFLGLGFGIAADAAIDLVLVEAGVGGGIQANIALSMNDPNMATDGGKLRYSQILDDLGSGPLGLFDFSGELTASLNAFVSVGIGPFSITKSINFCTITLLDFNSTSPPPVFATENASGVVTLDLTPGNADTSGATKGIDNFTIEDLGPDKQNGGEIIDINAQGQDQVLHGVTAINGEGEDQPFDLNIQSGVSVPIQIAGGYFPDDPDAVPTTNAVQINDLGSGPATIYASDGNDDIHVSNGDATIYGGNDTTNGANPPKDIINLGNASTDGGTNYIYGGTADETLVGGAGNDYISAGNSPNAILEGGGGDDTLIGGDGSDHFVADFDDDETVTIEADSAGTNVLEVDGDGGGDSITAGTSGGKLTVTSVDGQLTDSVTASNIQSLDIEPAPGLNPSTLNTTPPGGTPPSIPTPPAGPINITINNLNGSGLTAVYVDMLGAAANSNLVNPIYVTINGLGNDNISILGTDGTFNGQSSSAAELYQITSQNTDGGLTIFTTDGPTDTLTYNVGTGSNTISLQNQAVLPGDATINSLASSTGTDSYTITAVLGTTTIGQDGKNLNVTIGSGVQSNPPFSVISGLDGIDGPVAIGGAVSDSGSPTGYDGSVALTVNDSADATGGPGAINNGSISGFDLGNGSAITWAYLTSLNMTLGNHGNQASVDLTKPMSVTIQAGNGGDNINAVASTIPMTLLGGSGNDSIYASNNGDYIDGNGGNDLLSEGATRADGGLDTIIGGNGSNTIIDNGAMGLIYGNDTTADGATGANNISGTAEGLIYTGPGQDTVYMTGSADETVYAGGGNDAITVGNGNDSISGSGGNDTILAGNGNDTINAGSGNDSITAGGGEDIVYAGAGAEHITLGDGSDLITAGTGTDVIHVGNGNDNIYGDSGGSTITTGNGQDIIYGGPGNDSITAGGGNDFINPGTGTDYVNGGSGHTVLAVHADSNFTLSNSSINLGALGNISIANITTVSLTGGPGNNTFDVSAWTGGPVQIMGNGGTDTIASTDDTNFTLNDSSLSRSDGTVFSLIGISVADLTGGSSDNTFTVTGWSGSGTINGNGGVDTLIAANIIGAVLSDAVLSRGGDGNLDLDEIEDAEFTTSIVGNVKIDATSFSGAVALYGEGNDDTLIGGSGDDYLIGSSGSGNTLTANGSADNQLIGGAGSSDTLNGGPGQNLLVGSTGGSDVITTGSGTSHVYTPGGHDTINAQNGNAVVYEYGTGDTANIGSSASDTVLTPGAAGTTASDFVALAGNDPWSFPSLPAVQTSTLPTGGDTQGQWIEYAESAAGGGVSNSPDAAIEPSVAVDSSDDEFIAWADDRSGVYQIYVAEHTASGWEQLANSAQGMGISNASVNATQPAIALNSSGEPVVAWTQVSGSSSDIYAAYFNGTSWQAMGSSLSAGGLSNTSNARGAQIVNTSAGITVAWLNTYNTWVNVYVKQFNGTSWNGLAGSASNYGVSNQEQITPGYSLATNGTNIAVAWTSLSTAAGSSVYLLQYSGGSWSAVNGSDSGDGISGSLSASSPSDAYAGDKLYAAWAAVSNGRSNIFAAGNNGSAWSSISIETADSPGINQVSRGEASDPVLSANGANLDLVWLEDRLPDTPGQAVAIYANRLVNGSFVYQLPTDSSFDGILGRSTSLSQPTTLALAVDSNGHPFVTWGDDSSGSSQVYALADTLNVNKIIYVNDTYAVTDFYTTAAGNDSNSGASASQPLATITAALAKVTGNGDVILVDGGSYAGFTVSASNDNVLILGVPGGYSQIEGSGGGKGGGGASMLSSAVGLTLESVVFADGVSATGGSNLGFINDGGAAVTINGSSGVIFSEDAFTSITLSGTTSAIDINNSTISGAGLAVNGTSTSLLVNESTLYVLTLAAASQGTITNDNIEGGGLIIDAAFTGSISDNLIHGASVGVTYAAGAPLNSNDIYDNSTGVLDTVNSTTTGLGFVAGSLPNFIFDNSIGVNLGGSMQDQSITFNTLGVSGGAIAGASSYGTLGGTSLATANLIEANTTGIEQFPGTIQYNDITRNQTSIVVQTLQFIEHNVFYDNAGPNLETQGASNVEIINNTFYSTSQTNIEIDGGSSDVEVLNNILWTGGGYDLYIASNSRSGFFSDYNDLYTTGAGLIVHDLVDFSDVLDWQDDVDLYDLHSIGTTSVNPTGAQPEFVGLGLNDFTVYPAAAGIASTSPTIAAGDQATDLALPVSEVNLISNPLFDNGITGWTVNPGGSAEPMGSAGFDDSGYFFAGSVATGYAQQTISLLTAGYTAAQIDAGTLDISFGGRIRSANEAVPDQGELVLTFLDANNNPIGTADTLAASNVDDRWELVSGRVHVPAGARSVDYRFENTRETGSTDDSYLDAAFLYVLPNTQATDIGALGNMPASVAAVTDQSIHLISPDLYVNWSLNQTHAITWFTYDNTGDSAIRIDLYQQTVHGLVLVTNITPSTPDTGSYAWIPANSGLSAGTTGLVIKVSLVTDSAITDRSTETFTIPAAGTTFYVNDNSTRGDQYTTAVGSNRNTGMSPADPLPSLNVLFRTYSLGGTDTVYVDNGTYNDFSAIELSSNPAIGSGAGVTILGPTNSGTAAVIQALGFTAPAVIDVNDAAYVTLCNLALEGANYGVWIHNTSPNFVGSYLIAMNNLLGGIRVESDSSSATFAHLTISTNTGDGFYAGGPIISLTNSSSTNNTGDGFDFANSGSSVLTDDTASSNISDGFYIDNTTSSTTTQVGSANLALSEGDIAFNNGHYGIEAFGAITVAGDTVYGQTATNYGGINLQANAVGEYNVVYGNYTGITASGGTVSFNTVYNNTNVGIEGDSGTIITDNTVYNNSIGIKSSGSSSSQTVINNLVYNNSTQGIWLIAGSGVTIYNNTVYEPTGDAIYVGANSSNIKIENNILWTLAGVDIFVDPTSESGFKSDYNDLYYTAAGNAGEWENVTESTLLAWSGATSNDPDSISANPLFVNAAGGDFHEQSTVGSYHGGSLSPIIGGDLPAANPGMLTADASQSPAIDRGDPAFAYSNEPSPNGGFINLGAFGNTSQASLSPSSYVLVLKPITAQILIDGQTATLTWRSQDTNGTVNIDLLHNGNEYLNIATGVANTGSYSWTLPVSIAASNGYTIQITRNTTSAIGDSGSFTIASAATQFYVNGSGTPGVFTTAAGNDANSGLDPAHPKATIQALLAAYQLGAGDTIFVDEGTYNLSSNLVLTSVNNGLTIDGAGNAATILDRTNTSSTTSYVFDLQVTNGITIENLAITGGYYGINAVYTTASDTNLTIKNDAFYSNNEVGLFLANNYSITTVATGDVITNNVFHDMLSSDSSSNYYGYGLEATGDQITLSNNIAYNLGQGLYIANGAGSTVTGNTVYQATYGIDTANANVSGNIVHNTGTGIEFSGTGYTLSGNTIYNNTSNGISLSSGTASGNVVYGNSTGIEFYGDATASDNLVYNNSTAGINGANGSNILGNVLYGNGIGITLSSYASAADGGPTIENNLVYNNVTGGIYLSGGDHTPILNNTVYQTAGYALEIASTNTNDVEVRDNIFWVTSGLDISVGSAAEQNVAINFNDLYATGSGQVGQWNGVNYSTLATWQTGSGMDGSSISADPLFVNAAAADFHVQSQYGSDHGGTLAPTLNTTTGLPQTNPGTWADDATTSPTIDRGAATDPYVNEPAPNGGYVNLGSYGNTAQASISPAHYLLVLSPVAGATVAAGQAMTITWRDELTNTGAGNSDTDTIELVQGTTVIATFNAPDTGSYSWTPSNSLSSGVYQLKIIRTDGTGISATGPSFNIEGFAGIYYVNGSSTAGTFTTAGGSDSNSGLDPMHPKADIAAILNSYTLAPGNIIMVDQGTYNLSTNIILTAADDGITIEGVAGKTILNRGNTSGGDYVFSIQSALNLTLENLNITGADYGIEDEYQDNSTGLTITGCYFYGDEDNGITLGGFNGSATITNNTFDNMLDGGYTTYGLSANYCGSLTVTGNTVYGLSYGLSVSPQNNAVTTEIINNNTAYDCSYGISAGQSNSGPFTVENNLLYDNYIDNLTVSGTTIFVSNNTIYEDGAVASKESSGQAGINQGGGTVTDNTIYGNVNGINTNAGIIIANNIYNNSKAGITSSNTTTITDNTIDDNGTWGITGSAPTISNNLIYGNTSGGIYENGAYGASILGNTVYQTTGPAFRLDGLTKNGSALPAMTVQNNIFWTTSGPDLLIDDTGEQSFTTPGSSDYNDLYATGTGLIATMAGQNFTTVTAWAEELGLDVHSISADPQFVSVNSDNFHVQSTSPTIDAGNPTSEFISEPEPNGGRVNLGYDGDTAQAATSSASSISVTSPGDSQRLQVGQSTTIMWSSSGLLATQTLTEVAVGESSAVGEYHAAEFLVGSVSTGDVSSSTTINTSLVTNPAPTAVYQNWAQASSGVGNTLAYQIPVPDGTYTIRLDFSEPYYSGTGSRIFDIILNGTTVQSAFDIAATAGNATNKAVAETFTVTASSGSGISLVLKNDTSNPALLNGFEISATNANGTANPTANVQVSTDNGNSWTTIATNQSMDAEGRGSFVWSPTVASNNALIRVVANNGSSTTATSTPFMIAPSGVIYYVNDNSTSGDSLTTAVGNNANDGKTPATPMASVEAVLNTYQPGAGDTIEVDNGSYTLFHTLNIPAIDAGVTISGPLTGVAVLNRNNTTNGDYVINLFDGASNVTIENLSLTGAFIGIYANETNLGMNNAVIADNTIYGNNGGVYGGGIYSSGNLNWTITGNTIHDNSESSGGAFGIETTYGTGNITNNIVYNELYGIDDSTRSGAVVANNIIGGNTVYGSYDGIYADQATVQNNIVHDNSNIGIYADEYSFVTGNTVYRQTAKGTDGIVINNATVNGNVVYDNYIGIYSEGAAAHIYANHVYSNLDDGLSLNGLNGSNAAYGYNYIATVYDNLIYANGETGIYLGTNTDLDDSILNNTIYQLAGDAIEFGSANSSYPTTVENNIIWVEAGYDLRLDSGVAAAGVISDYNDLYHLGNNANVGLLSGTAYNTLAAWQTASSLDSHSTEANPDFVDPAGADAVLGYNPSGNNGGGYNGGADDNFFLAAGSPAIAAGNAGVQPSADALGYTRTTADIGPYAYRATSASSGPATVVSAVAGAGPSDTGISQITVTFSQPVNDIDADTASLYSLLGAGPDGVFGTADDIPYAVTPSYVPGSDQVILTLASAPLPTGNYQLTIYSNSASSIHNLAGLELDGDANGTQGGNYVGTFSVGASVVGRHIFYNDSSFDGNNLAANASDDNAIATDKQALLPGQTATFANYTSFTDGINGIMIDILGLPASTLTAADFSFLVGNTSSTATWTTAPAPQSITVRSGAGADGSARIEITWANNAIEDEWLQITVNADANTGLSQPDVFYFGNAIGESGNSSTDAAVTIADALGARGHISANPVSITSDYDFNRDGVVSAADVAIAEQNLTNGSAILQLISPAANVPGIVLAEAPSVSFVSSPPTIDNATGDTGENDGGENNAASASTCVPPANTSDPSSSSATSNPGTSVVPPASTSSTPVDATNNAAITNSENVSPSAAGGSVADPSTVVVPPIIVDPIEGFHLVIVKAPTAGTAGKTLGKIVVYAEDVSNKIIQGANGLITLSADIGTLAGHASARLKHGKVVFSNIRIESAGTYTITADDQSNYAPAITDAILITDPMHKNATQKIRSRHA